MAAMGGSIKEAKSYVHCVSEANAWFTAHALSMVMWSDGEIVNGY